MKKLLIAMTAAAVGTCAWATEGAGGDPEPTTPTVTYLDESFSENWTLANNAFWSYTGTEETELAITNVAAANAAADYALALNTGSKVLTGSFASDKNPVAIGTDGLYFKSTVTFNDPSDTLPTLGAQDKFALVVLDNVESVAEGSNTTNLWVIAGHGTKGKCAYMLCPDAETLNLDKSWLDSKHEIEVKAYADVLEGDDEAAGFLVMIDNEICTVKKVYDIGTDGVIDFSTGTDVNYLGYESTAIIGSLGLRYSNKQLLISAASGSSLASVDFQGQGVIDNVALATTTEADFGADAMTLKISATANVVTDIACDSKAYAETGYIIPANAETVTVTFKLASGYVLSAPSATKDGDVYTYTYAVGEDINQSLTISAFVPAAYVGDTAYETFAGALAAALKDGGTLKLGDDVTAADFGNNYTYLYVETGKTLVLDLNGKTIQGSGTDDMPTPSIFNEGTLTIKDSARTGCVKSSGYGAVLNAGTLTIEAGIFDGAVTTDGGETSITGGKFLVAANETLAGVDTTKYTATNDGNGYWVVAEKQIVNYTVTFNVDGNTTAIAAQTVAENGTATEPADDPTKNGYTFAGWKLNDAAYDFATAVTGDITLVATWTLVEYAITYAWNGLEAGATPVNSNPAKYTIEDGITFTAATCDGYTFKGFSPATITVGSTGGITVTGTFEKNAPAVTPVEPGAATEYETEDAAKAAVAKTEVKVPAEVAAIEGFDSDAYKALFKVTTKQAGNKWVVSVELTEDATATLQQAVETAVKALPVAEVAALTTGGAAEVNVTATPGLYYSVESGVSLGDMVEGNRTLATGSTVNLELKKQGNSGFYRIKVSVKGK